MHKLRIKTAPYFFVASGLFLISLDQAIKYKIRSGGGFYICNKEVAFGFSFVFALALIFVFIALLFILNFKFLILNLKSSLNFKFKISNFPNQPALTGIILIISGAISNIIDRLHSGCVIDYINLRVWPASIAMPATATAVWLSGWRSIAGWTVFNLADVYITIGGAIIIVEILHKNKL